MASSGINMGALAAQTDSFAAADLKRLASRIAHHAAARALRPGAALACPRILDSVDASEQGEMR